MKSQTTATPPPPPAPETTAIQWVKDRWAVTGGVLTRHTQFTRNDSSNSNSSNGSNSAPPTNAPNTPIGTPVRSFDFSHFKQSSIGSFGSKRVGGHAKLAQKTSTASLGAVPNSGSLRRQRFKQNYQSRSERRMSRQASNGNSVSSQELSTTGTSITTNPIIDKILDYVRDSYVKSIDPFQWNIDKKVRLTSFASFRLETGSLDGVSNFERIGDCKLIKPMDELTQIVLATNILFTDLVADIRFSTRLARFTMRNKMLRIIIEKCVFYLEISIDHTMSAKLKTLRLITIDGVETRTSGIAFPLNKSIDAFALKTIHTMAANSDQYMESIVTLVNQFCDNLFENAIKSLSITDLFW